MSKSHARLKFFRQIHLYFGVFISPALVFFAFTGALQTFNLHEKTAGSSYNPPSWVVRLSTIHKKATLEAPKRRAEPNAGLKSQGSMGGENAKPHGHHEDSAGVASPAAVGAPGAPGAPAPRPKSHLPLKLFFLVVSIGLFTSTLTGIYMAYKFSRGKWLITGLLAAGVVLPLVLLAF